MQSDLFDNDSPVLSLPMQDACVEYIPRFLGGELADSSLQTLVSELAWRQDHIKMFGKTVKIPRLQAWYGDKEAIYTYSGLTMKPLAWTPCLLELKQMCEQAASAKFNGVLANLYRNEQDSMGWHADDEPELGERPVIASLTLGEARDFDFKHKITGEKHRVRLAHGSLLIMSEETQKYWFHAISKRTKTLGLRVNLTFRFIHQLENTVIRSHL
ncbi:alpha-ketoglutarate-dependent dioxygenase AlkB [Aestuariibacter sp. AA17]|uniref:Alpha-ketoglutarate-dependent dioxygenase AlkB n=1 Tax=Fluctibacter corallii TaxID=2984329 RepID=A0ABT3A4F5_9ALTE|nr:alpha-ketoglutarate-dependent dioxygenase AlkB [Aestuariibacter sp. AA17]MCV2883572.1 alpha-ketoglutarate-dependent dioxygenase AlkB [Aestuariibacter sp. AA17]